MSTSLKQNIILQILTRSSNDVTLIVVDDCFIKLFKKGKITVTKCPDGNPDLLTLILDYNDIEKYKQSNNEVFVNVDDINLDEKIKIPYNLLVFSGMGGIFELDCAEDNMSYDGVYSEMNNEVYNKELTQFTIEYFKQFKMFESIGIDQFLNIDYVKRNIMFFIALGIIIKKEPVIMEIEIKSIEQLKQFKGLISEEHYWEMMAKLK